MKFYDRKLELRKLSSIYKRSEKQAELTVLAGRRRVGKTRLILKSLEGKNYLYFFVAKKNETLLCEEYVEQIKEKLQIPIYGQIVSFKDVFQLLVDYSKLQHLNLVIDEFQQFDNINSSIYSQMQDVWDRNKEKAKLNLIVSGSVFSLMNKIFQSSKEPLFGRATERMNIKAFDIDTLKLILKENYPDFTKKDLLAFYIFTGGIPKYVELLVDRKALSFNSILNEIFTDDSYFLEEGKNILIEEFGKEYTTYFSILSLLASSKTSRTEIESILEKNIGGYLERLEKDFTVIEKKRPILAKDGTRTIKYEITDNFLNFWFRFIYKNKSTVEIGNFDYIKKLVIRDFDTFSGRFLEKYFKEKLVLSKRFSLIGNYWEKGNKNEIDIIAVNELDKKVVFYEVKLNKNKISLPKLELKAQKIVSKFNNYKFDYKAFSLEDM